MGELIVVGLLALGAGWFVVLEQWHRSTWRRVVEVRQVLRHDEGPYREAAIEVATYATRAPTGVRAVALLCITLSSLALPALALALRVAFAIAENAIAEVVGARDANAWDPAVEIVIAISAAAAAVAVTEGAMYAAGVALLRRRAARSLRMLHSAAAVIAGMLAGVGTIMILPTVLHRFWCPFWLLREGSFGLIVLGWFTVHIVALALLRRVARRHQDDLLAIV